MTDVVTSPTAISQSSLYAIRPQAFSVERIASTADNAGAPQAGALPANEGPSRARVDIGALDLGSGDLGSGSAGDSGSSIGANANTPTIVSVSAEPGPLPSLAQQDPPEAAAAASDVGSAGGVSAQGYVDQAVAASGTPGPQTPDKLYGKGAEVVVGGATPAAATVVAEKPAPPPPQPVVKEDYTGETRQHDKVAQSEAEQPGGQAGGQSAGQFYQQPTSLYERGQQIAAAMGFRKTGTVEVAAYGSAAAATSELAIVVTPTDVTA